MKITDLRARPDELGDALLMGLCSDKVNLKSALCRLAAFHQRSETNEVDLRSTWVEAGEHLFPSPDDVPLLAVLLLDRIGQIWPECRSIEDDLVVAAFALDGLLKIHPFADCNGHVSIDFSQLLLMHRWGTEQPPLALPDGAHEIMGGLAAGWGGNFTGSSVRILQEQRLALAEHFFSADLPSIRRIPALSAMAGILGSTLRDGISDTLPTEAQS